MTTLFDIEKILRMLPHRYPFLLVDRVLDLKPGKSIVAIKNVTINESFFQGHFPDYRVMPGVLVVEALAQTGVILLYNSIPDPEGKRVFLSKIDNLKFRKPVVPGDQIRLEVEIVKLKSRIGFIKAKAIVDQEVVTEGEIWASLVNPEGLNE
ncbi:MAG: 3-hydroxyacyl-ACP dehydratase FabZ [Candidatus Aminicenantes bacterium]|nr:MAG: 3-hydroxyacyl-ACP dehydratase FabZ [Candidatus Aminicenantes bacterium]